MGWLEDILNGGNTQQNALLAAASTGGALAPVESASAGPAPAAEKDPLMTLVNNYQRWAGRHGGQAPLPGAEASPTGGTGFNAAGVLNQMQGSSRQGQGYMPLTIGGARYHVYFDEDGKRQIVWAGGKRPARLPQVLAESQRPSPGGSYHR